MKLPPVVVYTVLRLLAFLVPFGLLMLIPIMREYYWLTAIFAARATSSSGSMSTVAP